MTTLQHLTHMQGGHYKFWKAYDPEWDNVTQQWRVTLRWGRIGTAGQTTPKFFLSRSRAETFIEKKVTEKIGKGYTHHNSGASYKTSADGYAYRVATADPTEEPAPLRRFILRK